MEDEKKMEIGDFYEKSKFEREKGLNFPVEIMEKFSDNGNKFCLQCSSCHGCR